MAMQDIFSNFDFTQGLLNLYNPQGAERRRNRLKEEELQTKRQAAIASILETMGGGLDERQQLKQDAAQISDVITAAPTSVDVIDPTGDAANTELPYRPPTKTLPLPAPITGAELDTLRSFDKEEANIESGQDRSGNMFNMTDENVGQMRDILKGLPASDAIDVVRSALSTSLSERIKDQFKEKKEKKEKPSILSKEQSDAFGFAPNTIVQKNANGSLSVLQAPAKPKERRETLTVKELKEREDIINAGIENPKNHITFPKNQVVQRGVETNTLYYKDSKTDEFDALISQIFKTIKDQQK